MMWFVTFGGDHVFARGRIFLSAERAGLPLRDKFIMVRAANKEEARATVMALLGGGNWCDIYEQERGAALVKRYHLIPLLDMAVQLGPGQQPQVVPHE